MAAFRLELNKASALIPAVGGQLGQAKFAESGVRAPPGHATRVDQKKQVIDYCLPVWGLRYEAGRTGTYLYVQRTT